MAAKKRMTNLVPLLVIVVVMFLVQSLTAKEKLSRFEIEGLINLKAWKWGVETALVYAVIETESNFDPRAKNPADPSYGLMQITPMLAQDYGYVKDWRNTTSLEIERLYDPPVNLDIGCQFLGGLLHEYTFDEAVQMYNVGEWGYEKGVRNLDYLEKVRKAYGKYK